MTLELNELVPWRDEEKEIERGFSDEIVWTVSSDSYLLFNFSRFEYGASFRCLIDLSHA
jgi:hypothetical protein